jgi:uncharacterized protein YndB with AHSA1/START domain
MNPIREASRVVVERFVPHKPEKVWHALTEASVINEWLMKTDFQPNVGRRFTFRAAATPHWNGVVNGVVMIVEPYDQLSYRWTSASTDGGAGLNTVVTWTLVADEGGTVLRMEQSGFGSGDDQSRRGAEYGWQKFFARLEAVLDREKKAA